MKTIFITLCIFAVIACIHADDSSDDTKSFEDCLAENGIKQEEIEKLKERKDPKLKCIMACVLEKEGVLENGQIDSEAMKESMTSEIPDLDTKTASELVDKCMNQIKDVKELCDKANVFSICLKEGLDKLNIKFRK